MLFRLICNGFIISVLIHKKVLKLLVLTHNTINIGLYGPLAQ